MNVDLDRLLQAWKREVVPDPFPARIDPWPPLGPAYRRTMRRIWDGSVWRRHVLPPSRHVG